VNVEDALAVALERLSDAQLVALAAACEPLRLPADVAGQVLAGAQPRTIDAVAQLFAAWRARPDLTGAGVALALRAGLAARRAADANRTRPVWTGPGALGEERLTANALHELICGATKSVLLVSYAAHTIPEVAADLEAAVERGCRVDVAFETSEDSGGSYSGQRRPFATLTGLQRWRWPHDQRDAGAVLHAKLLVIDARVAFVGSANLTARALRHNLEVGVIIRDPAVAEQLVSHVHRLMATGVLVRGSD
jgi:phosphatidylserine/phosphatidylglycerophosphate/cardiolipin synthase-like enzyme